MGTMQTRIATTCSIALLLGMLSAMPATADPLFFSTGNPDGKIATASRPDTGAPFEIESADDFTLTNSTSITSATFTGLVTGTSPTIGKVVVEVYEVFPNLSNVNRTSGPPTFSTPNVPTRVNSPSNVELDGRDSAVAGELTFSTKVLNNGQPFTANNSVQPGGIPDVCPCPPATPATGGNGPITGQEVEFDVTFTTPFLLPADHYFFVPQVEITDPTGNFFSSTHHPGDDREYESDAANHRISLTSVPWRDEMIDRILVNIIDLLPVVRLPRTLPCFIRLRLAAEC
jgi:hypothetical protein